MRGGTAKPLISLGEKGAGSSPVDLTLGHQLRPRVGHKLCAKVGHQL